MATGRTISASFLTEFDNEVINLCKSISDVISNNISNKELEKKFKNEYGKISITRDGGLGLGAGKLQQDAIYTRGRQGKAPYSNRNLRWHPLIVAENSVSYAKEIENIRIDGENEQQTLVFIIKNVDGGIEEYPSDKVHELPERFVALPKHWLPHINTLKTWNDTLWTQNSCIIPAYECCEWYQSVETYSILGIAIAVNIFNVKYQKISKVIKEILKNQTIDNNIKLPTKEFPNKEEKIINCPICKSHITNDLNQFRKEIRAKTWQPAWRNSKKEEGEDSSIQIMHLNPLIETDIRHTAENVRYGHRWCNVAMTDHSIEETVDFMEFVVRAHKRINNEK